MSILAPSTCSKGVDAFMDESASTAAASRAVILAQAAVDQLYNQCKSNAFQNKCLSADTDSSGTELGLHELCWLCHPDSNTNFAHLCLIIQVGHGTTRLIH
jgi:hypothetical protein